MEIREMTAPEEKQQVARQILEGLPEWFGIAEAREEYIAQSAEQPCFAAMGHGKPIGFLCLSETGRDPMELAVMGVDRKYHRRGCGRALFAAAKAYAVQRGYSFLQVKTVQMGHHKEYDDTNRFYQSLGFKELEVFPNLWDECNPCQIYIMAI